MSMRLNKEIKIISLFVAICTTILASTSFTWQYSEESTVSLYEYGNVASSKDNLDNLFNNFSIYIENGKDIDFLSYQFKGTIKNKREAKKYVRRNFNDLIPIGWITSYRNNVGQQLGESSAVWMNMQPILEAKSELRSMAKTVSEEYINIGDEVYKINYVYKLQKHAHYVFINPETKKVLLKGNIFGIDIPVSHFNYINDLKVGEL